MSNDDVLRQLSKFMRVSEANGFVSKDIIHMLKQAIDTSENDDEFSDKLYQLVESIR